MLYEFGNLEKQHFRKQCSKNPITDFQNRKNGGIACYTYKG